MTPERAKQLIADLGLTGVEFAELMNANVNYVSNFNRKGVPQNIAIILDMSHELLNKKISKKRIIEIISNQVKRLDNASRK
ncbi:MAG: hypothetical protein PHO62_07595 [Sulfurimonas sp.]|uniref:hypothetical protein n=1 Tax=Sulfurimonas sp. TaxID=2022749 RepID=UPI00262B1E16|nr:hypothetical protein [Sulfurimonas sp.]MDD5373269.1 hypothetical protein [Sulfurimonas sp.]